MTSGTIEEETKGTIEAIRAPPRRGRRQSRRRRAGYNKVFGEYFKDAVLACTTIEARAVINTKVEMHAIAYKPR